MNRSWVIYTLEDPRGGGVRYVGVTHQRTRNRLAVHLDRARKGTPNHLYNWLRKLLHDGIKPRR